MTAPPTVFIHAYGCQMNKLDAELVLSSLAAAGYEQTADILAADVILYCTCSVRGHAEERVYSNLGALRRHKARRPGVVIGVLGCMAQKDGVHVLQRAPHVDLVCGTRAFPRIAEFVEAVRRGEGPLIATDETQIEAPERNVALRPHPCLGYVTVMRGCDNYCAYCIVPYVRGRETSRPIEEILDEARRLVDDGVREITLLGQNVNSYGMRPALGPRLPDLLERLNGVPGLLRVRFVTSHPRDMSLEIFQAMRDLATVCESVHMPAQSGSDRVLAAMRRGYTAARYRELLAMARETVPGITIASDFIVGFPGETEADFEETAALVREARFQNCFIFKYSPRPGTRAAEMEDDVPEEEKKRRNNALLGIQETISLAAHKALVGSTGEVLVEGASKKDPGMLMGRLRTNEIVHFAGSATLRGRLVRVRVRGATPLTLQGEMV
ncbi:MAG TPA: tRNA (N6-isopentenyl adenosine(37)-C2)-methylthiotransferase MiaB [Candidatus Brocadiia bacterium]|nr:tRNA (N6-isopentenyl adenosine(37)-C2)-methylthiotransferase MiaB [Candidatus Brocadiia bacterium]